MEKITLLLLLAAMSTMMFTGCNAARDDAEHETQQLAQIEVYAGDGNLLSTVSDQDVLQQFSELHDTEILPDADSEQSELEEELEDCGVLYKIVSYKEPAAVINDGSLEKLAELTVYEGSNIVHERVAPENVKAAQISEEYLGFYMTISDEDKDFILSLADEDTKAR